MLFCACILVSLVVTYFFLDWLIRQPRVGNYGNKHVLITGCRAGFGRDLALRLDKLGFHVWATFHSGRGMKELKEESSSRLRTLILDVSDDASIRAAYDTVRKELPDEKSLWGVVSNAGIAGPLIFAEMVTRQEYLDVYQTNTLGPLELTRTFAPLLRKSQGRVVLMTSIVGRMAVLGSPYCSSKFALEAAADILRHELRTFGIKVSVIEPGVFRTDLVNNDLQSTRMRESFQRSYPEIQNAYTVERLEKKCEKGKEFDKVACGDISKVTNAYVDALTCKCPRTRYVVGTDAKIVAVLTYLPTWLTDFLIESSVTY